MNDRKVIFGNVAEEKDTQTLVAYQASDGERVMWIPHAVIECRIRMNSGDTAYVLNANNMTTGSFPLTQAFAGERSPLPPTLPQHIEVQDLVEQGAAEANIRAALKASAPTPATTTPTPAPVVDMADNFVELSASTPTPAPQTVEELLEAEAEVDDSTPVFNPTESQVVAKKVDPDAPDLSGTAWDGALLTGGRHEASVPWDFEAKKIPLLAPDDDGNIHRLTNKGGN